MGETAKEKMQMQVQVADERTPLVLVTTVKTAPPRQRYTHHNLRRACTTALSLSLVALFAASSIGFDVPDSLRPRPPGRGHDYDLRGFVWPGRHERNVSHDELKHILLDTPSSDKCAEWQRYYTAGAHLAGQNYSQV